MFAQALRTCEGNYQLIGGAYVDATSECTPPTGTLPVSGECPAGYNLSAGRCIPGLIPGVSNTMLIIAAAAFVFLMLATGKRR